MINIKNIIVLLSLFIQYSALGQNTCGISIDTPTILSNKDLSSLINDLQIGGFRTCKDKSQIPNVIRTQLNCLTKDTFRIANPNESYRCCCTSPQELPGRKLLFFSMSKDFFLITYLTGGMGVSTTILIFKLQNDKIIDLWRGVGFAEFKSKDEVVKFMKEPRNLDLEWIHGIMMF
jgi:hypothetical protein